MKNDISLVFLDDKKLKQCLKDLERDTNIRWFGGKLPTKFKAWELEAPEGFIELRINQPDTYNLEPFLTYGTCRSALKMFLEKYKGVVFLIK